MKTEPFRALLAVGMNGSAVVLATDGAALAADVEEISDDANDLGVEAPRAPGLYLWTGTAEWVGADPIWAGPGEPYTRYEGVAEAVGRDELYPLLAMEAPERCHCGRNATTDYEGEPSCGSAACELNIQRGLDYHGEVGDR